MFKDAKPIGDLRTVLNMISAFTITSIQTGGQPGHNEVSGREISLVSQELPTSSLKPVDPKPKQVTEMVIRTNRAFLLVQCWLALFL